jgi:hypothetical protein
MRPVLRLWLALATLAVAVAGAEALAGRKPQEYREPARMTEEEREAAKARSRSNLNAYSEKMDEPLPPFPWRAVALAGLVLLGATPFAVKAYREMARELPARKSGPAPRRRDDVGA